MILYVLYILYSIIFSYIILYSIIIIIIILTIIIIIIIIIITYIYIYILYPLNMVPLKRAIRRVKKGVPFKGSPLGPLNEAHELT